MNNQWIRSGLLAAAVAVATTATMSAQDGPRMPDGKPDLSGVYTQPSTVNPAGPRGSAGQTT